MKRKGSKNLALLRELFCQKSAASLTLCDTLYHRVLFSGQSFAELFGHCCLLTFSMFMCVTFGFEEKCCAGVIE